MGKSREENGRRGKEDDTYMVEKEIKRGIWLRLEYRKEKWEEWEGKRRAKHLLEMR